MDDDVFKKSYESGTLEQKALIDELLSKSSLSKIEILFAVLGPACPSTHKIWSTRKGQFPLKQSDALVFLIELTTGQPCDGTVAIKLGAGKLFDYIHKQFVDGLEAGQINRKSRKEGSTLSIYAKRVIRDLLNKDKRLNGGVTYKPRLAGKRKHIADKKIKELHKYKSQIRGDKKEEEKVDQAVRIRIKELQSQRPNQNFSPKKNQQKFPDDPVSKLKHILEAYTGVMRLWPLLKAINIEIRKLDGIYIQTDLLYLYIAGFKQIVNESWRIREAAMRYIDKYQQNLSINYWRTYYRPPQVIGDKPSDINAILSHKKEIFKKEYRSQFQKLFPGADPNRSGKPKKDCVVAFKNEWERHFHEVEEIRHSLAHWDWKVEEIHSTIPVATIDKLLANINPILDQMAFIVGIGGPLTTVYSTDVPHTHLASQLVRLLFDKK